ncbi:MAG: oxidoreductase [Phycisphaerae bacterium]|nr:oxidoreductase [Phycisphaerae bacterium]
MTNPDTAAPVRFGMVGGGSGAFIGAVHRMALALDHQGVLVAGALSSTPERSLASAKAIGLPSDRAYGSWDDMLKGEKQLPESERIQAVSIVTPNDTHFEIAKAFVEAGCHVVLDKPMVTTSDEAAQLARAVGASNASLTVTYNYSGYPMVREARELVRTGAIGDVRKVFIEYHQGWLSTDVESSGNKQASWRTDPKRSGGAGSLGDIGTHAEQLASFITGQTPSELCADVHSVVPGRQVDDDAAVLFRYASGATGVLTCSQVCFGEENGLSIRLYGDKGSLAWRQEDPNNLYHRAADERLRVITRGSDGLSEAAAASGRIPPGHPEGFIEAFANIYRGAIDRVRGVDSHHARLAPTVDDGAQGIRFVEACLRSNGAWTDFE